MLDERGLAVQQRFLQFLQQFRREDEEGDGTQSQTGTQGVAREEYVYQLENMRNEDRTTILVNFQHVVSHDIVLAEAIRVEYYR